MSRELFAAPSILSADFSSLHSEIAKMEEAGAKFIHLDVMDGRFVPNVTFGPDLVKKIAPDFPSLIKDTHLMVSDPLEEIPLFAEAGSDIITVHFEAFADEKGALTGLKLIRSLGKKAGISIKPNTPPEAIDGLLPYADLILVMSVEPGKGGQSFMPNSLAKISYFSEKRAENGYSYLIEVDGGINGETSKFVVAAGVDVLVAGSYLYGHDDYAERLKEMISQ